MNIPYSFHDSLVVDVVLVGFCFVLCLKNVYQSSVLQHICIFLQVSFLEETNAVLRKEISLIKARYGIPADQNIMTPEERAACMQVGAAAFLLHWHTLFL